MAILAVFVVLQPNKQNDCYHDNSIKRKLLIFVCYFLLTIPLVRWPGSVLWFGLEFYLKVVMFFFFIAAFVTTEKQLKILVAVVIGCQVFRGLEPVYLHITTGYLPEVAYSHGGHALARLAGAPHDVVSANPYAWVIVTTVPFLYYLCFLGGTCSKILTVTIASLLGYGLILSGSRTGLIILLVVVIAIACFGQKKVKSTIVAMAVIFGVGFFVVSTLSPDLTNRYLSIVDSSVVGADTAKGRINGIKTTLTTISNFYGLLGHGLGTSREVNANYLGYAQITHNLYVELFQEVGIIGFFIFCFYIMTIFKSLQNASKKIPADSYLGRLAMALKVWIIMDIVYGFACYGVSSWEWYVFGGIAAACVSIIESQQNGEVTQEQLLQHPDTVFCSRTIVNSESNNGLP
jgi:O-antigen ligase